MNRHIESEPVDIADSPVLTRLLRNSYTQWSIRSLEHRYLPLDKHHLMNNIRFNPWTLILLTHLLLSWFFLFLRKCILVFYGGGVLGFFISTYVMYRKVQVYDWRQFGAMCLSFLTITICFIIQSTIPLPHSCEW